MTLDDDSAIITLPT